MMQWEEGDAAQQQQSLPGMKNKDTSQMVENILMCKNRSCSINVLNFPVWACGPEAASVHSHGMESIH